MATRPQGEPQAETESQPKRLHDLLAALMTDTVWAQGFKPEGTCVERRADGGAGGTLGGISLAPYDTLEERIVRQLGRAPAVCWLRLWHVSGKPGPLFLVEVSSRAWIANDPHTQQQPPQQYAPGPIAAVPTNPFSGALEVITVVSALTEKIDERAAKAVAAAREAMPAAVPPAMANIPEIIELATKAAGKETWLDKLLPFASGLLEPAIDTIKQAAHARAVVAQANAAFTVEQVRRSRLAHPDPEPPPAASTAEAQPPSEKAPIIGADGKGPISARPSAEAPGSPLLDKGAQVDISAPRHSPQGAGAPSGPAEGEGEAA